MKIRQELEKTYENKSATFIDEKVEEALKPFKKEIKYSLQLLYYVFKEISDGFLTIPTGYRWFSEWFSAEHPWNFSTVHPHCDNQTYR